MIVRSAGAVWEGTLKEGNGTMKLGDAGYEAPFTFASRFESADATNPEELVGAAHAGCFSMFLSAVLGKADFPPKRISTSAAVHLDTSGDGPTISTIELTTTAEVPNIDDAAFQEHVQTSKKNCPVSKALSGVEIKVTATLV